MNWDEILKQPRRPGRRPQRPDNGGGGGTRDRVKPASDSMLLAFTKCIVAVAAIFSILYGIGIPLYLAYQCMVGE